MTARLLPSTGMSCSPWITTVNLSVVGSDLSAEKEEEINTATQTSFRRSRYAFEVYSFGTYSEFVKILQWWQL